VSKVEELPGVVPVKCGEESHAASVALQLRNRWQHVRDIERDYDVRLRGLDRLQ
jgi:hypothetical protein